MFLGLIIKCEHNFFAKKTIIIKKNSVAQLIKQKRKNINSQNSIIIFIFIGGGEGLESLSVWFFTHICYLGHLILSLITKQNISQNFNFQKACNMCMTHIPSRWFWTHYVVKFYISHGSFFSTFFCFFVLLWIYIALIHEASNVKTLEYMKCLTNVTYAIKITLLLMPSLL